MSDMTGMDVAEVRGFARQMNTESDDIWRLMQHVTTRLESGPWVGNDQRRFLEQWHSHLGALSGVIEALRDASTQASSYADSQERVSDVY